MPSTRLNSSISNSSKVSNKIITRSNTCKDLFTSDDLEFVCQKFVAEVDILSFSKKIRRFKSKHRTNQCDQSWNESYATTNVKAQFHHKACDRLKFVTTITMEDDHNYKKQKLSTAGPSKNPSESDTSGKSFSSSNKQSLPSKRNSASKEGTHA